MTPVSNPVTFNVGGEEVHCHNDELFSRIRRQGQHDVKANFLADYDFTTLRLFGGKGGNLMSFTTDRSYLVKELSDGDHASLLKFAPQIVDHLTEGRSLIVPMFLHFTRPATGKNYLVMRNALPSDRNVIWHKLYDIKGNRDDKLMVDDGEDVPEVHKRCFYVHKCWYGCDVIPLCNTAARKRYYRGKLEAFGTTFQMSEEHSGTIVGTIKRDTELFKRLGLMDYSLVCGIIKQGQREPVPPAKGLNQFVLVRTVPAPSSTAAPRAAHAPRRPGHQTHEGHTYIYYLGIIDFLQEWTSTKTIAMYLKTFAPHPLSTVPPPQYAEQFYKAMENKFRATSSASSRV